MWYAGSSAIRGQWRPCAVRNMDVAPGASGWTMSRALAPRRSWWIAPSVAGVSHPRTLMLRTRGWSALASRRQGPRAHRPRLHHALRLDSPHLRRRSRLHIHPRACRRKSAIRAVRRRSIPSTRETTGSATSTVATATIATATTCPGTNLGGIASVGVPAIGWQTPSPGTIAAARIGLGG